jgi:hypothetical protein
VEPPLNVATPIARVPATIARETPMVPIDTPLDTDLPASSPALPEVISPSTGYNHWTAETSE